MQQALKVDIDRRISRQAVINANSVAGAIPMTRSGLHKFLEVVKEQALSTFKELEKSGALKQALKLAPDSIGMKVAVFAVEKIVEDMAKKQTQAALQASAANSANAASITEGSSIQTSSMRNTAAQAGLPGASGWSRLTNTLKSAFATTQATVVRVRADIMQRTEEQSELGEMQKQSAQKI